MISEDFLDNKSKPRLVFFTGAGLSAESGVSTFRDSGGLWERYDVSKVCEIDNFMDNYYLTHQFYNELRAALEHVHPNAAHQFIADIQKQYGTDRVLHCTANVDDLTDRLGVESIKLHGDLKQVLEPFSKNEDEVTVLDVGYSHYSTKEGVIAKPNVVFFGESYRYENNKKVPIYDERNFILDSLTSKDIAIVIGSSDQVIRWSWLLAGTPAFSVNVNPVLSDESHMYKRNIVSTAVNAIPELQKIISDLM